MITVVSGLPRSGTSLMMQILEANGFNILTDTIRQADENNLKGYYEFEKVKSLMKDSSFLNEAEGKVIKVIAQLIPFLPNSFEYNVIFMERNIEEVLASQKKMLDRLGSQKQIPQEILKKTFLQQVEKVKSFMTNSTDFKFTDVSFNNLFNEADKEIAKINSSLDMNLQLKLSQKAINPGMYRGKC